MTAHGHSHGAAADRSRLVVATSIIAVFFVVQVVGAFVSGSVALAADAGHMASDVLGLVVALVAAGFAARPANDRQTFGFQRAEVFGALANGLLLTGVAVFVSIEAVSRLVEPDEGHVAAVPMLVVAIAGGAANLAALLVLRGGNREALGLRGAYLEVLGDLLGSIAVVVAAVVILATRFEAADAIASLVIAALMVPRAVALLRDVFHVLSEAVPRGTDVDAIRSHILGTSGVVDVHDVHVWAITSGAPVFSAHVVVEPELFEKGGSGELLERLGGCLAEHFDVEHSTFQLEPAGHSSHEEHFHR